MEKPPVRRQLMKCNEYKTIEYKELAKAMQRVKFHVKMQVNERSINKKELEDMKTLQKYNRCQLANTQSELELWTDGSVTPEASGGSFMILRNGKLIKEGTLSLGAGACSYSMERSTIRKGVEMCVEYCNEENITVQALRIVTDSLSTLQELQKGPFYQKDEEMERIWAALAQLPALTIHAVFVFSHTEDNTNNNNDCSNNTSNNNNNNDDVHNNTNFNNYKNYNTLVDEKAKEALTTVATEKP